MTYEQSVKLVECLQRIEDTINLRPHNWLLHCASPSAENGEAGKTEEKDIVPYLLHIVFYLREEAALLVLKLLVALFEDEKDVCLFYFSLFLCTAESIPAACASLYQFPQLVKFPHPAQAQINSCARVL